MEYNSQLELYLSLIPVFRVKHRLLSKTEYYNLTDEDMWKYLSINKWRKSHNLTISEMVNDIITLDTSSVKGAK